MEKINLQGNWVVFSLINPANKMLEIYPDSISNLLQIQFSQDSVFLIACETQLGSSKYLHSENNNLNIEDLIYIEPCSNIWLGPVARNLSFGVSAVYLTDTLHIFSEFPAGETSTMQLLKD